MAKLSAGQLLTLARAAGFSSTRRHKGMPEDRMAVAIALGESGGNTESHNKVPPDDSYGLWQINMLGALGPERRKQFGISSNDELFNPAVNARAANMVFRDAGNSFRPWSVYTSGSWMRHRSAALGASPEGTLPDTGKPDDGGNWWDAFTELNPLWGWTPGGIEGPVEAIPGEAGTLVAIANALKTLSFFTDPNNWKRTAMFVGGGIILIIAILGVMNKLGAGKAVNKVASAVPASRAVKAVAKKAA